jgi:hypothetical protein
MGLLLRDIANNRSLLKLAPEKQKPCFVCKIPLQETLTGKHHVGNGHDCMCSDCYFDGLGAVIDASPVSAGRVRRG